MKLQNSDQNCKNVYEVKRYKSFQGRRFALLYETTHWGQLPAYYPNAFASDSLARLAANTQINNLYTLQRVYQWAETQEIDLEFRVASRKMLTVSQVESLTRYLSVKHNDDKSFLVGRRINSNLHITARYLTWLFHKLVADSNSTANAELVNKLSGMITSRKTKIGSRSSREQKTLKKFLKECARDALMEMFNAPIKASETHFQQGVSFRNSLALYILYDLGLRIGELLSLKLSSFIPARGGDTAYLVIERNQDDAFDRRIKQPVAKTLGRMLPVSPMLEKSILQYLGDWRADVPNAGFSANDFLFIIHKAGPHQGRELEISTMKSAFSVIIGKDKRLKGLHPHLLRHDWNYRFSIQCNEDGLSEAEEVRQRELLMGWEPGSNSAKIYNRRHLQEAAHKTGLKIASDTAKRTVIS